MDLNAEKIQLQRLLYHMKQSSCRHPLWSLGCFADFLVSKLKESCLVNDSRRIVNSTCIYAEGDKGALVKLIVGKEDNSACVVSYLSQERFPASTLAIIDHINA